MRSQAALCLVEFKITLLLTSVRYMNRLRLAWPLVCSHSVLPVREATALDAETPASISSETRPKNVAVRYYVVVNRKKQ